MEVVVALATIMVVMDMDATMAPVDLLHVSTLTTNSRGPTTSSVTQPITPASRSGT